MKKLLNYFPELTGEQQQRFAQLEKLYREWNARINVISRQDIDHLMERHVLHALAIAKIINFKEGTRILDVGTGGGFPGIPLAIMFPDVQFHLVDSIGKKIKVVKAITEEVGLLNINAEQVRAESIKGQYDFVVSRAVAALPQFLLWTRHLISKEQNNNMANGILYLKGGDIKNELTAIRNKVTLYQISDYFEEPFFETKMVVHIF